MAQVERRLSGMLGSNLPKQHRFSLDISPLSSRQPLHLKLTSIIEMPKRFIVCCDGTWCDADKGGDGQPSNVAQLSRMLARQGMTEDGLPIEQVIYYQTGIGTGALNEIDRIKQGM